MGISICNYNYRDGRPIIWDAIDHFNNVEGPSRITYKLVEWDSTRMKWKMIHRVFFKT